MKQKTEAITAHHVVQMIEKEARIKEKHNVRAATMLGVVQIIFGIVALGVFITRIVVHDSTFSFDKSIWVSILFFVSGMFTLARYSRNTWLVVTSMVMAASSTLVATCLLVHAGISHGFNYSSGNTGNYSDFGKLWKMWHQPQEHWL